MLCERCHIAIDPKNKDFYEWTKENKICPICSEETIFNDDYDRPNLSSEDK